MTNGVPDHALTLLLIAIIPLYGVWGMSRLKRKIAEGSDSVRMQTYSNVLLVQWVMCIGLLAWWFVAQRDLPALGLGFDAGRGLLIGAGLLIVAIVFQTGQTLSLVNNREKMEKARGQFEDLKALLPHNTRELRAFAAVSVTAGICEEILYRGFLMAYLGTFMGTWMAVVVSSLIFGLGHLYQGPTGILKTAVVGLVMASLYVLTGSLWVPIILHAAIDLNAGYLGRRMVDEIFKNGSPDTVSAT